MQAVPGSLIIQNTRLVLPNQTIQSGMIKVQGGEIIDVIPGGRVDPEVTQGLVIDANGHYLFPGAIASPIHFDQSRLLIQNHPLELSQSFLEGGITSLVIQPSIALAQEDVMVNVGVLPETIEHHFQDDPASEIPENLKLDPQFSLTLSTPALLFPRLLTHAKAGEVSCSQVAQWLSTDVAKHYGLLRKGAIANGYDADFVLIDLENYYGVTQEVPSTSMTTTDVEGTSQAQTLTGWPLMTFIGGEIAFDHGDFHPTLRGTPIRFSVSS